MSVFSLDHFKRCSNCECELPLTQFHRQKSGPGGYRSWCKACRVVEKKNDVAKHHEKRLVTAAAWRDANRERFREMQRSWRAKNPARQRALEKAWEQRNQDVRNSHTRNYRARKRAASGSHTQADVLALFKSQRGLCVACRQSIATAYEVDHIMPLARGGANDTSNLQLLCPSCNRSKNDKHPIEFMRSRGFLL